MNTEIEAVDALARSLSAGFAYLGWKRVVSDGDPGLDLGLDAPYAASLIASAGEWSLSLTTARGLRRVVIGSLNAEPEVILDALSFAVYSKATAELDHRDRAASAGLSEILRRLSIETSDARYGGRAAALLAGHALRDGQPALAQAGFEDAVRLFTSAGDMTAADAAREQLDGIHEFTTT